MTERVKTLLMALLLLVLAAVCIGVMLGDYAIVLFGSLAIEGVLLDVITLALAALFGYGCVQLLISEFKKK